jgi:integrase
VALNAALYFGPGAASSRRTLKVSDVDSKRMLLRIEQGKGQKDRFALLSPVLLELLRDWYRGHTPREIARNSPHQLGGKDRAARAKYVA